MELVRKEFVIEAEDESGQVVARDSAGTILASGRTTSEVVRRLQEVVCARPGEMIPWAAVVRFRPDGSVGLTGVYRVVKAEARGATNRPRQG
jgi:hypothetical protein